MDKALEGKTAIITGAGSGIGRAAALLFAPHGASLVLGDKTAAVHDTALQVQQMGGLATALQIDAGVEDDVASLVAAAQSAYGRLDVAFVNAICPGLTETGMTKPTFDYAQEKGLMHKVGRLNPLRRAGQPEELAQVALFLASVQSSYVNGQAIAVDGGLSSSHPVTRQLTGQTAV